MRINHKLISGFIISSLLVGVIGLVSLRQLGKISEPFNVDIPSSLETISSTSILDGLAQFIRYYDEVLTQSARNYAFTKKKKWKLRYKETEPRLDEIINEAIARGDNTDKMFFSSVDKANLALVDMEYKSIKLVDLGQNEEAIKILESDAYWNQKESYKKGLVDYVKRRGIEYDKALFASVQQVRVATENTKELMDYGGQIVFIVSVLSGLIAICVGFFISRSITKPIASLKAATAEISKGSYGTIIDVETKDEIGELAASFNRMTGVLKETMVSKDYVENIIGSMVDCLVILDPDATIRTVNQATCDLLGYSEDELIGSSMDLIVLGKEEIFKGTKLQKLTGKGSVMNHEMIFKTKKSEIIPVLLSGAIMRDKNGKITDMVCVAKDFTERKKMEEERDELFLTLGERMKELQCLYGLSEIVEEPDVRLQEIFQGLTSLIPASWRYPDIACARIILENVEVKTDNFKETEWKQSSKILVDGNESGVIDVFYLEEKPVIDEGPFLKEERTLINALAERLGRIVERKKAEEEKRNLQKQLLHSQKMDSIGTLANGIAHNFNNILGAVRGFTEMALDGVEKDSRVHKDLERAIKSTDMAKQLTAQMLTFSRVYKQETKEIEIAPVVREVIELFKASTQGGVDIREKIEDNSGYVKVDPNQLQHMLLNIYNNSFQSIKNSSDTIKVELQGVDVDVDLAKKVKGLREGKHVKITIRDTGHGMDEETLGRIFEPFFTTKEVGKGTGLGLSMVHGIIESYDGEIMVESELGAGTTVSIYLPRVDVNI